MTFRKNNAVVITTLLAVAAMVCLGVGLRLLAVSGEMVVPTDITTHARLAALLSIGGGLVVFLLGTVALLAARRGTIAAGRPPTPPPASLDLVDIREWSRELADLRDDMQRDLAEVTAQPEILEVELEVPASWRPEAQYLISDTGEPADPLADLKRTRDQLMEAANRVDAIVQSINESTLTDKSSTASPRQGHQKRPWWKFR